MLEGIITGFIVSLTLFPGTVWLAKVGRNGTRGQVVSVAAAFALSQLLWLLVAIPGLLMMTVNLSAARGWMYGFAAFVLGYMAVKMMRARRATALDDVAELPHGLRLFRNAFNRSLAMPMRLPVAVAVLLSTGIYAGTPTTWNVVPSVLTGALIGVTWWWGQMAFLAVFFVQRVPQEVTLKSMNKIRPFCCVLYLFLALRTLFLMA